MNEKNIQPYSDIKKKLQKVGFDPEEELKHLSHWNPEIDIPRIRIEHKDNGRHRMYIDYGESYLNQDLQEENIPENCFEAVVFAEQFIRALWAEDQPVPVCSSIDFIPLVENPVSSSCQGCREAIIGTGNCKPKVRLWLLMRKDDNVKPFIMNLSPTSIKHWEQHKRKLRRSELPVVAVNTVFSLKDVKKNGYRWAEVEVTINGIASEEMLVAARKAREDFLKLMDAISPKDFEEPGDRVPF